MGRSERTLWLWGSAWGRVAAACAVCCAILGYCLPAQAAVTRTGTLDATVAENLRTGQSTTRYTLKSEGETTGVAPTELAAEPGDRVAVTGAVRDDRLVGTVEAISPSTQAAVAPGPRKTAVVLFTFPGDPTTPWSADEARSKVFTGANSVDAFYREESYGKISLTGKLGANGDVFGWLRIDSPTAGCPYGEWRRAADDAAAEAGIDLGGYDHLIYMFPRQSSCTWEGIEGVAANGMMLNGNQSVQVIAHEMGHSLGLQHAGSWTCTSGGVRVQISDDCTMTQYGDPFDIMGNIAVRHSNGSALEKLGFLAPENVRTIDASGVYQLHSALHPTSEPTVLRIRRKTTFDGETSYYYLEVREQGGIFENVSDATTTGVSIRVTGESYTPETLLIDANPATATFQDAPLGVGQTFEGGPVRITTQSAAGGNASVSVTLDEAPPTQPTGLTATAGSGVVNLQWQAASDNFGVDRYVVLRDGVEIGNPSGTQFQDSDATVGAHTYRVIAEDEVGNRSAPSSPATATVERDEVPPTAPTELTATPEVDGVWLEWEASTDDFAVERYVVSRDGSEIATTTHNELIDSSPAAGDHTYLVYAEDAAENRSEASEPATATLAEKEGPYCESGTCTVSFWHTGTPATWTVPPGVSQAKFTVEGAEGGGENSASRSQGARAVAKIASLSPGEQFAVSVGGAGSSHSEGGAGGFGGGGDGTLGAGGGGYSSVSRGPTLTLLAGGGGGAGLAGFNASTGEEPGGGSGGSGGEGTPGSPGVATLSQEATLGGGGGGGSGDGGGPGGGGGTVSGTSACPEGVTPDAPGAAGASLTGGGGAPGAGGGGGGGYVGGGQGGGGAGDVCGGTAGAGGGGGGSSYAAPGLSPTFIEEYPARLRAGKDLLHEPGHRDRTQLHDAARPGAGRARRRGRAVGRLRARGPAAHDQPARPSALRFRRAGERRLVHLHAPAWPPRRRLLRLSGDGLCRQQRGRSRDGGDRRAAVGVDLGPGHRRLICGRAVGADGLLLHRGGRRDRAGLLQRLERQENGERRCRPPRYLDGGRPHLHGDGGLERRAERERVDRVHGRAGAETARGTRTAQGAADRSPGAAPAPRRPASQGRDLAQRRAEVAARSPPDPEARRRYECQRGDGRGSGRQGEAQGGRPR